MPRALNRLVGSAAVFVAIVAICGSFHASPSGPDQAAPAPPAPSRPPDSSKPKTKSSPPTREDLNRFFPRDLDDAELAGMSRDSRPVTLTWERIYALALIRSRAPRPAQGGGLAESLDLNALTEQSERYAVADFARFRREFLAAADGDGNDEGRFRDPAAEVLDLLRGRQEVEIARWNIAAFEHLMVVIQRVMKHESSDVYQLELDQVEDALQRARLRFVDAREQYRNRLDALKVRLGLAPHAPVALDRAGLAGFHESFEAIDRWCAGPNPQPVGLPPIVSRLPKLEDVVIDGHSGYDVYKANWNHLTDEEGFLSAGTRVAIAKHRRGDKGGANAREIDDAGLELKVRGVLRRLLRIYLEYGFEKRRLMLVTRRRDQAQEHLLAPPRRNESRPERTRLIPELLASQGEMVENQTRLVALWTEDRALRLDLQRDLSTLPQDDWKSFCAWLTAERGPEAP